MPRDYIQMFSMLGWEEDITKWLRAKKIDCNIFFLRSSFLFSKTKDTYITFSLF